jgi:hypothetical protein
MPDQLSQAEDRLQQLPVESLGASHPALADWAVVKFAIRDARRFRESAAAPDGMKLASDAGAAPPDEAQRFERVGRRSRIPGGQSGQF